MTRSGPSTRALLVGILVTAAVVCGGPARAEQYSGTIIVGHPGVILFAIADAAPCQPDAPFNGIDAHWFAVPGGPRAATLTMSLMLDADAYFYTAACDLILDGPEDAAGDMDAGVAGETESGSVPAGTANALVTGFYGTGDFSLVIH